MKAAAAVIGAFLAVTLMAPLLAVIAMTGAPATATNLACRTPLAAGDLGAFLAAVRSHESGGNYEAHNPSSTASGAYQFLDTTWRSEAAAAGQPVTSRAMDAPPAVQDAVAGFMATAAFNGPAAGDWARVADVWYVGHVASLAELDVVPGGGNTITPRQYEEQIGALMSAGTAPVPCPAAPILATTAGLPPQVQEAIAEASVAVQTAIGFALAQVGKPYRWGGTGPDGYDCSGLTQAAWKAAGVLLPRTTYEQVLVGQPVARADLQPGDLLEPDPGHVQLYLGAGYVVEAQHTGTFILVDHAWGFWQARRVA